jgi:hypothetical protein
MSIQNEAETWRTAGGERWGVGSRFDRHCEAQRDEAIHRAAQRACGIFVADDPLRQRFAFVAGKDG